MLCNVQENSGRLVHCRSQDCQCSAANLYWRAVTAFAKAWSNKIWSTWRFGKRWRLKRVKRGDIFLPRWFVDSVDVSSSKLLDLLGPRPYSRQIRHCPCSLASRVSYRKIETLYITLHHFKRSHRHLGISFKIENTQRGISYGSKSWIQQIAGHGTWLSLPFVTWGGAAFNGAPDIALGKAQSMRARCRLRCVVTRRGPSAVPYEKYVPVGIPEKKKVVEKYVPLTWDSDHLINYPHADMVKVRCL